MSKRVAKHTLLPMHHSSTALLLRWVKITYPDQFGVTLSQQNHSGTLLALYPKPCGGLQSALLKTSPGRQRGHYCRKILPQLIGKDKSNHISSLNLCFIPFHWIHLVSCHRLHNKRTDLWDFRLFFFFNFWFALFVFLITYNLTKNYETLSVLYFKFRSLFSSEIPLHFFVVKHSEQLLQDLCCDPTKNI